MPENFNNNPATPVTLAAPCGSGDATITITNPTALLTTGNYRLDVDAGLSTFEIMLATGRSGAVVSVIRAQEGTAASAHIEGASVTPGLTAGALNQLKADAIAAAVAEVITEVVSGVQHAGTPLPTAENINFIGTGWTVTNNPGNNSNDVAYSGAGASVSGTGLWASIAGVLQSAAVTLSGDVSQSGTSTLTVTGLLSNALPSLTAGVLEWTGTAWILGADGGTSVTGTGLWFSSGGSLNAAAITLDGDVSQGALSGSSVPLTVTKIQGNAVASGALVEGDLLIATSTTGWAATAVTGDVAFSASSPGATEVVGLLSHTLPGLATGFLEWTGSAWAFGAGGGTSITGTGLWYSASGALDSAAVTLAGDVTQGALSGSNVPLTVAKIQGNTVTSGALTKGDFFIASTTSNWAGIALTGDVAASVVTPGLMEVTGLLSHALPSVAAGFLQWTGSAWAFGTPSGTFGTSNVLYVATNGNDTTGNGSPAAPYATYGNAATVAVGLGAAAGNLFVVLFAPGSYSENIVLVPWVTISGIDAGSSALLNGTITISSAWAGSSGVTSIISNCDVLGAVNINSLAFGASGLSGVQFTNCSIFNNVTSDGTGAANFQVLFVDCVFDACAMVMSDVQLITFGCDFYDDGSNSITLSAPTFGANWTSYGGEFSTDLTVHGATGHTSVVDLVGTIVKGSVTLNGTLATYGSTLSGIPGGGPPILTGGATSAQYTISGIVPVANLSTSTNGNVLTMVAGVPTWSAPSGGTSVTGTGLWYSASGALNAAAITLDGDVSQGVLSGSNVPIEVTGLLNHALPGLATGYLQWTGSAWAFGAGGGGTSVTGTGLWFSSSGSLDSSAVTLGGDVTQSSTSLTVVGIQGQTVTAGALVKGDLFIATTTSNWAATAVTGDLAFSSVTPGLTEVLGLLSNVLPSLTAGYLQWTGSAWAFGAGGGGGGGGGGGNPTGLPPATEGLTLSLHANLGVDPPTGNVLDWSDWARPGLYWTTEETGAVYNPTGIHGLPTLDFTAGTTSSYTQGNFAPYTGSDAYVFPTGWTIGAIVDYAGDVNFSNWVASPQIVGGNNQGVGLLCGLDPANADNVIFGAFTFDASSDPQTVQAVSVPAGPHYVIASFDPTGFLRIWVDGAAVVTSGPWTFPPIGLLKPSVWTVSGNVTDTSSQFDGSILRIDTWCRALAPLTEIPALQAFYVTDGSGGGGGGGGGESITGTGIWWNVAGTLNSQAIALDGDVTMGSLSGSNVPLTVTQAQGGLFEFGSGGAIFWANGVTPVLSQAVTTGTTGAPFNIDPQQSSNANGSGGSVVVNLQVPNGTGAESHFEVIRGAAVVLQAGYGSGATAGMACLWMTAPSNTNPVMYENAGDTFINATSNVQIAISTTSEFYLSTVGTSLFGVGADFGNGVGMLSIGPCTTPPTTTAGTSFMLYYDNSTDAGLVGVGPNTSAFVRETIAGVYGGVIGTQNGVIIRRGLTIRTIGNTTSSFNLANVSSGNAIYVEVWAWGKFVTGSFGAYVGHAEALFVNGGTLNVTSSTTLFNSNAGVTIGFTAGGTTANCTLTGEAGNTVDWTVSYTIREA